VVKIVGVEWTDTDLCRGDSPSALERLEKKSTGEEVADWRVRWEGKVREVVACKF
jgi:hypothetical protein